MSDAIDRAVAAVQAEAELDAMNAELVKLGLEHTNVTISETGRVVGVTYPIDLSEGELLSLASWFTTNLRLHLAEIRNRPRSPIVVPASGRPPHA